MTGKTTSRRPASGCRFQKSIPATPVSLHPPKDQAKLAATRRKRTYAVELERDVNRRLRVISENAGIPAEAIISQALRAWITDADEGEADV